MNKKFEKSLNLKKTDIIIKIYYVLMDHEVITDFFLFFLFVLFYYLLEDCW